MRRRFVLGLVSLLVAASPSRGECNYHGRTELLLSLGTQALMIRNGVFVSNRTPRRSLRAGDVKAMLARSRAGGVPPESVVQFVAGGVYGLLMWWLAPFCGQARATKESAMQATMPSDREIVLTRAFTAHREVTLVTSWSLRRSP
jgi:hypothetical protein